MADRSLAHEDAARLYERAAAAAMSGCQRRASLGGSRVTSSTQHPLALPEARQAVG